MTRRWHKEDHVRGEDEEEREKAKNGNEPREERILPQPRLGIRPSASSSTPGGGECCVRHVPHAHILTSLSIE